MRFFLQIQFLLLLSCTNYDSENEALRCFKNAYPSDYNSLNQILTEISSEPLTEKQIILNSIKKKKRFKSSSFYGETQAHLMDCLLKSNLQETNQSKYEAIATILSYSNLASLDPTLLDKTVPELSDFDKRFFQDRFFAFCIISVYSIEYNKELPAWEPLPKDTTANKK